MPNDKPHIIILATGGTIAGLSTNHKEYRPGALSIDRLLDCLNCLDSTYPKLQARISTRQIANIDSANMNNKIWLALTKEINTLLNAKKSPHIDGIVITHGTDTLEESAYFLHLSLKSDKPIVLVGAMRPANAPNSDGKSNLYNAIALACQKNAKGVMVVMNEKIFSPRGLSKRHTLNIDAFNDFKDSKGDSSQIGWVKKGKVVLYANHTKSSDNVSHKPFVAPFCANDLTLKNLPKIDILYTYSNDGSAVAAKALFKSGTQGLVIAGSGAGSIHKDHKKALKKLIKRGLFVVVSSRINSGQVLLKRADKKAGFISALDLNPQKARILLMLALTQTKNKAKIQTYFKKY